MDVGDFNLDGNNDIITNQGILFGNGDETFNTTAQALPVSVNGGNNVSNTLQAVFLGNSKQGFVGFASSGNSIVSVVNDSLAGVSIDLESSNNPANPGSDVQFTVSISSADSNITATPTGEVTFLNGSSVFGMAALVDGTATFDAGSSVDTGVNTITAQYAGDAKFAAATSSPLTQTGLSPTITTVTSNENPSLAGDDVIFTAMVSGNDGAGDVPSGNVEFFDNGTDLGGGSLDDTGTATFDTTGTLAVGSHSITAQYQADSNFSGGVSTALMQTVNQPALVPVVTATTLPSAIVAGVSVHGKVTVALTNQTSSTVSADQITVFRFERRHDRRRHAALWFRKLPNPRNSHQGGASQRLETECEILPIEPWRWDIHAARTGEQFARTEQQLDNRAFGECRSSVRSTCRRRRYRHCKAQRSEDRQGRFADDRADQFRKHHDPAGIARYRSFN